MKKFTLMLAIFKKKNYIYKLNIIKIVSTESLSIQKERFS